MTYLEHIADCACLNLRKAAKTLTAQYNEILAPSGILITQLPILAALEQLGAVPLSQLSSTLEMDRTTLSRNLGPLQREGLVSEIGGPDKRTRVLAISDRGRTALKTAVPLWMGAQQAVKKQMGDQSVSHLLEALKEVSGTPM
jgi:DNA-binding MarR family transcriptional regulator